MQMGGGVNETDYTLGLIALKSSSWWHLVMLREV
jgi:hypothetical protein